MEIKYETGDRIVASFRNIYKRYDKTSVRDMHTSYRIQLFYSFNYLIKTRAQIFIALRTIEKK